MRTEIAANKINSGIETNFKDMFEDGETTEFSGKAIVHLSTGKNIFAFSVQSSKAFFMLF